MNNNNCAPTIQAALSALRASLVEANNETHTQPEFCFTAIRRNVKELARVMKARGLLRPPASVPSFAWRDRVFARWRSGHEYPGTIVGGPTINYDFEGESGDDEEGHTNNGKVSSDESDAWVRRPWGAVTYDVLFDDGDRDRACPASHIRLRHRAEGDGSGTLADGRSSKPARTSAGEVVDVPLFVEVAWCLHMLRLDRRVEGDAWRFGLSPGSMVDARDTVGLWCQAKVTDVRTGGGGGGGGGGVEGVRRETPARPDHSEGSPSLTNGDDSQVHVSYVGWGSGWDEWINVTSERIQPWRSKTRRGDPIRRLRERAMLFLFRIPPVWQLLGPIQEALLLSPHRRALPPADEDPVQDYHRRRCRECERVIPFLRNEARRMGSPQADDAVRSVAEALLPLLRGESVHHLSSTAAASDSDGDGPLFSLLSTDLRQCVAAFLDPGSMRSLQASRKSLLFLDSAPSFAAALAAEFEDVFRGMTVEERVRKRFGAVYAKRTANESWSRKRSAGTCSSGGDTDRNEEGDSKRRVRRRLGSTGGYMAINE